MNQENDDQCHRRQAEDLLARPCRPDEAARAHLTLGCVHEHELDWEAAIASYRIIARLADRPGHGPVVLQQTHELIRQLHHYSDTIRRKTEPQTHEPDRTRSIPS